MSDQQVIDYMTNTVNPDTAFQTSLNIDGNFTIAVNSCNWRFVIQIYRLFKVVEAGMPRAEYAEELAELKKCYETAYGTAQKVYNPTSCAQISDYLDGLYGP
jgi:hypothetical protein